MEMKAEEEIGMGEDVTPPLFPLTFALHDSFLHSHCSSCFSSLPNNPNSHHAFLYCSPLCYSKSHSSTSISHLLRNNSSSSSSTDLRAALRLLLALPSSTSPHHERISGLLTNRNLLMQDHETAARVRDGAEAISAAFLKSVDHQNDIAPSSSTLLTLSEAVLCLVITNAVEVQDKEGRSIGIAVYGVHFSWINHSCSPNACYRFFISPSPSALPFWAQPSLRLAAHNERLGNVELTDGCAGGGVECGPRVVVRSIKRINRGEEVTIAYTDLLQPKAIRQSELWSKYCFGCCCARCATYPSSYIDCSLEEICASNLSSSNLNTCDNFKRDEAYKRLIDYVDEVIAEYLSVGDPESCCEKLENILTLGILDGHLTKEGKQILNFRLHPLHHLALKAYMMLASAYKIRGIELLTLHSEVDGPQLESFKMIRTSAAYSFFLAAATNHLSRFESSLIVNVANLWTDAGEAFLTLARILTWGFLEMSILNFSSLAQYKCSKCSLLDFDANMFPHQGQNNYFDDISCKFLDCIKRLSQDVWPLLIEGCHYLTMFKDLNIFSWSGGSSTVWDFEAYVVGNHMSPTNCSLDRIHGDEVHGDTNQRKITIFQLGVHCLCYGGILVGISYGPHSHLSSHIKDILYM